MKKTLLFLALALSFGQMVAQKNNPWQKISLQSLSDVQRGRANLNTQGELYFQLNADVLRQSLVNVASRTSGQPAVEISIPNIDGEMERYQVWENSNFEPELQAQFPDIRSYVGIGITDRTAFLRFSLSPAGIQTMVLRADKGSEFIEPYAKNSGKYVLFGSKNRNKGKMPFTCSTEDVAIHQELSTMNGVTNRANNAVYKTMRLAMSCTGEYAAYHGGSVAEALAAINATMTRVNGVFEVDLALHLNLIANTTAVIYTSAGTDPYSNAANMDNWNGQLQATLTAVIGEANYDIGHLFGASGGGGNAGCIGCVCNTGKGSGITSPADAIPEGDNFDIDYVAHEMGHQLGGNHTFSFQENNTVNVEPGSGSTIMAYAGITGATDVQAHSDPYFVYASILQIQNNLATKTCPVSVPTTNQTPVISAGPDWTIPKGTPFILTGTGSDPDGNALTYCWEQNDDATSVSAAASYPSATKTNGPNFRSLNPVSTPVRYMPNYTTVLNGAVSNAWEATSTVARTLNFTLTGRDNVVANGQTQTDNMVVTVSNTSGPFALTSQNTTGINWNQWSTQPITWSVNNTTALVGSTNVNIKLSLDNGQTWPITLAANTPNDGNESIVVPDVAAPYCRLKIEPVGNIYYALNSAPFAIGYLVTTTCNTYTNNTPLTIPDGPVAGGPGAIVSNTITVPVTGVISDINIGLNVAHTYPSDLIIEIDHPDTSFDLVWNHNCAGNNNFNVTLSDGSPAFTCVTNMTGTFSPASPLSVFNGKPSNGTWSLHVADFANVDTGTINSWSIEVCTQTAALATPNFGLADFALYPNPNKGNFTVQFNSNSSNAVTISVHDLRGRSVFENQYANTGAFSQDIQLDRVQSGIYLVTVEDGDKKEVKKIVIE